MATTHYIEVTDITDSVAKDFLSDPRLENWLGNVDNELERVALKQGLYRAEIYTPLNSIVKEYLVAYFCMIVFRDNIGSNNVDTPAEEKYRVKYDLYVSETDRLKSQCTKDLISNVDDNVESVNMHSTKYFVRG